MTEITLPRVAGYRELATILVEEAGVSADDEVRIDGRGLVASTDSFASQFAKELREHRASLVTIVGGSPKWHSSIAAAAREEGLQLEIKSLSSL